MINKLQCLKGKSFLKCRQKICTYNDEMINEKENRTFPFEEDLSGKGLKKKGKNITKCYFY